MKGLYELLGIEANPSTAYHPQTDGQTERMNQELEEYLRIYVNKKQNDWVGWLLITQFCHNDRQHSATGFSLLYINNRRHPFKGIEAQKKPNNQTAIEYIKKFKENWKNVKQNLEKAAEKMKKQHDKHVKPSRQYQPGDRVYLDTTKIKTTRSSKKLDAKFHRPFKILRAVGKSAYRLELPPTWKIHDVFHESKLKPVAEPQFPIQKEKRPRPPLEIIDGNEEHEVEEIQQEGTINGKKSFLVKWKGLPNEESTWEPETNLKNARGAIRDFYKKAKIQMMENHPHPPLHHLPNVTVPSISLSPQRIEAHLPPLYTLIPDSLAGTTTSLRSSIVRNLIATGNAGKAHTKRLTRLKVCLHTSSARRPVEPRALSRHGRRMRGRLRFTAPLQPVPRLVPPGLQIAEGAWEPANNGLGWQNPLDAWQSKDPERIPTPRATPCQQPGSHWSNGEHA